MRKVIIFIVSVGPNVFPENVQETIQTLSKNINIDDYAFFFVTDNPSTDALIRSQVTEDHLVEIVPTTGVWAHDYNNFMDRYHDKAEYMLLCHDDIVVNTFDFFNKSMKEIEGVPDEIGWIAYTNTHYHSNNSTNSIRGGLYNDRMLWQAFECHRADRVLDYPTRAVKTYGPYSHFNLIASKGLRKCGPCPNWTAYTMLVDEFFAIEAVDMKLTNVWVPDVFYEHPNNKQIGRRRFDLRFEQEAHNGFISRYGYDTPFTDETVRMLVARWPHAAYLANRNSYEWTYLK